MTQNSTSNETRIDRKKLVERHHISWNKLDGVLPIGNGEFAFGADATGLQTFSGFTMAHWGWHSFPLPEGLSPADIPATGTFMQGVNNIPEEIADDRPEVAQWLFDNPHRMKLGRIFFCNIHGSPLEPNQVSETVRSLNIWEGVHSSKFTLDGEAVVVKTIVHPERDLISVTVNSPLLSDEKLQVGIIFEYPTLNDIAGKNFKEAEKTSHQTTVNSEKPQQVNLQRVVDDEEYFVSIECSDDSHISINSPHQFRIKSKQSQTLVFSCEFSQASISFPLPSPEESRQTCLKHWESHWTSGGAIDLSESQDPRWEELERRIVLSQYHMAAQSSGSWPSPEIGLMGIDPWRSQFHMEMIWWHLAHYGLWGRWHMAEKALDCYQTFLPSAKALAKQLGYKGAMWPKSVGPEGRSATWGGNTALLWKQPHPIFFAELEYRIKPTQETLNKWAKVLDETAEHMADYPVWDESRQCASLTPCILPSESGKTRDGLFDIVYWRWGIQKAQEWRERLGQNRKPQWDELCQKLAPLPTIDGIYVRTDEEGTKHNQKNHSHPDPVGIYGMLPLTEGVDIDTHTNTLNKIWETWNWDRCWGWDFPWTAMAAAKTNQPELAVDALLKEAGDRNHYDETGLNLGGPCYYLPGNGGLLYAVALMAAGWDTSDDQKHAPGFPQDGTWTVRWEGLDKAL